MNGVDVFLEGFQRIGGMVHDAVEGLSKDDLSYRLDEGANSIAWLIWHLTRIQDDHVAHVASTEQVWTSAGWADRFGLDLPVADHGYGHTPKQVASVTADSTLLIGYYDAVELATLAFVRNLTDPELDRVVDTRWDPPVTLGVRLVSVIVDDVAHAAQAEFVRGIIERR